MQTTCAHQQLYIRGGFDDIGVLNLEEIFWMWCECIDNFKMHSTTCKDITIGYSGEQLLFFFARLSSASILLFYLPGKNGRYWAVTYFPPVWIFAIRINEHNVFWLNNSISIRHLNIIGSLLDFNYINLCINSNRPHITYC